MELSLDFRPNPNPMILCRQVEGEAVLVHTTRGKVKVLNPAAALIWSFIDGQHTVAEIAAELCAEFEVEPVEAQKDVLSFLAELSRKDLVR
jgi:hypothetical protein